MRELGKWEKIMKCEDCAYYWRDDDTKVKICHYQYNDGYAPCEVDEQYEEPDDYYVEENE